MAYYGGGYAAPGYPMAPMMGPQPMMGQQPMMVNPMMPQMAQMAPPQANQGQNQSSQNANTNNNAISVNVGCGMDERRITCGAVCCALIWPPFGVCIYHNGDCCNFYVYITWILTILLWIPGLVFALVHMIVDSRSRRRPRPGKRF